MNETTTSQFQVKPDFYLSVDECLASDKKIVNTNPRYKFFNQTHFTAGDTEQFHLYRDTTNGDITESTCISSSNRYTETTSPIPDWDKYKSLHPFCVDNTFNYLFHKFKKGIFVKIKHGQLRVFLPFSKKNFTNDWHHKININPIYGDLNGFVKHIQTMEGYPFAPKSVNRFTDTWYANNCLVRYEFPIHEGDTNIPITSDMFKTLCAERKLPDIELFVNRRDFPLLKTNGTEPYHHIFNSEEIPLSSRNYDKYAPILSMVGADDFADIPIPTGEDWARVCRPEKKFFPRTCTRNYDIVHVPWEERKSIAMFRGASTGAGTTIETNPRLKLAFLSFQKPLDTDNSILLDAGITEWNLRPRKVQNDKYLQTIDISTLPFDLVPILSPAKQAEYKYVINIDGHVCAYRLSLELELGFCVLLVQSKYKLWFSHLLQPYVHYIPIKTDLSDLLTQIQWCKRNDDKCKQIAENAKTFAKKYLSKDGILDYLQKLFFDLKKINGTYFYNSVSLQQIQHEIELKQLEQTLKEYPQTQRTIKNNLSIFPKQKRSYELLQGIEWIVRKAIEEDTTIFANEEKEPIFESKATEVKRLEIGGISLVKKSYNNNDLVHEAFTSIHVINKLLKYVPNFVYTFGMYQDSSGTHLLTEYISGPTLYEYINSKEFDMKDFLFILLQLGLALHVAQKTCGFVHYDLTPWNCIVHKLDQPVEFDYVLDKNTVYRLTTQLIPVMIDFTRSHTIYNNYHYGVNNMFSVSTIQDILTVLNISIYEISHQELSSRDCKDVLTLANFVSGTKYRRKPFIPTGKNGLGDIRYFFGKAKKYSELITGEKFDLEQKTPLDFVKYIQTHFSYKFCLHKEYELLHTMRYGDSQQIFDYALSSTDEKRAVTFGLVFQRMESCLQDKTGLELLVEIQRKFQSIEEIKKLLTNFLQENKIEKSLYKKYEKLNGNAIQVLDKLYQNWISKKQNWTLPPSREIKYHQYTFLFPKRIYDWLAENKANKNLEKYLTDIYSLEQVFLTKNTPYVIPEWVNANYKNVIRHTPSTFVADLNTLRLVSKELFTRNLAVLELPIYKKILNVESKNENLNSVAVI